MNDDVNVLALVKGKERYLFLYGDAQQAQALRTLGRHASNPELSFSWYDAAMLSKKIRSEAKKHAPRIAKATADTSLDSEAPDFEELF